MLNLKCVLRLALFSGVVSIGLTSALTLNSQADDHDPNRAAEEANESNHRISRLIETYRGSLGTLQLRHADQIEIEIIRAIPVRAHSNIVLFQNGRIVQRDRVSPNQVLCYVTMNRVSRVNRNIPIGILEGRRLSPNQAGIDFAMNEDSSPMVEFIGCLAPERRPNQTVSYNDFTTSFGDYLDQVPSAITPMNVEIEE